MRWPDIFFKAKKPRESEATAPIHHSAADASEPATGSAKPTSDLVSGSGQRAPATRFITMPGRRPVRPDDEPSATSVTEEMAAADTLRALSRTGGLRLIKRNPAEPPLGERHSVVAEASPPAEGVAGASPAVSRAEPPPFHPDNIIPAPEPSPSSAATPGFRRKAKMTDLARSVVPPHRPEPKPQPPAAVVPPSFPVAVATGQVLQAAPEIAKSSRLTVELPPHPREAGKPPTERVPTRSAVVPPAPSAPVESAPRDPAPSAPPTQEEKKDGPISAASTPNETPAAAPVPETPRETAPPPARALEPVRNTIDNREKREFLLANGERILGHVLSESADAIYIDHGTLGVLTIQRSQLAKRLVEVILINGDRVVGDLIAETPECMYVRHASLGMLTVPHAQRSTRVVEAILKDGDRILGEVLAETENFTVIRSATLGTVAVQHHHVAMLNRKIEQIQLKALPPSTPSLENKPA